LTLLDHRLHSDAVVETQHARPTRFDFSPLGHPLWWTSLALLAVNDQVLKRCGFLPGWLTGKLSDFAFLVVAPVLLAALLPLALRCRRELALAAVVTLFCAAKVSPAISHALVFALAHVGLAWRLWPDPTDLVAVAVLPLTVRLLRARPPSAPGWRRRFAERVGVLVGAVACVATSSTSPSALPHSPFLVNGTAATATVQITWVLRSVDCPDPESPAGQNGSGTTPAALASSLTKGDLDDPRQVQLGGSHVAALDGPPPAGVSPVDACTTNQRTVSEGCLAAILEAAPAAPVVMVAAQYQFAAPTHCSGTVDPADPGPDAVTLKEVNGTLTFVAGANVRLGPVDLTAIAARSTPADSCRAAFDAYHALIAAPQTCGADADCVGSAGLPIPGDPSICEVDLNAASAATLATLGASWAAGCQDDHLSCSPPQPAVCRNGACAPACPGVTVPPCPPICTFPVAPGDSCRDGEWGLCLRGDGTSCSCKNRQVVCAALAAAAPGCPLSCVDAAGGGSLVDGGGIPVPDGG
jgi:hypothetical protein